MKNWDFEISLILQYNRLIYLKKIVLIPESPLWLVLWDRVSSVPKGDVVEKKVRVNGILTKFFVVSFNLVCFKENLPPPNYIFLYEVKIYFGLFKIFF